MDRTDWPGKESSPLSADKGAEYDVFLSFRGKDTRGSFTSHLYSRLSNAGILVFKDDTDLHRGNDIKTELPIAIERSTISVVIFSENYADSRWCLNELSKIMELHRSKGQVVLPVFYRVDPSDVRSNHSSFGGIFEYFMQSHSTTENEELKWRMDLREATNILGFVVKHSRDESEDIKNIVECVREILDKKDLFIANHPVGVHPRMQDVIRMSKSHPPNDVLLQLGKQRTGGRGSKYDRARYDVFLSFRGEDTRASFTGHLLSSLSNAGIVVFKDDANHMKGLNIATDMLRAIECSTISIIIFSPNYAGSRWCLHELSIIMELHRAQGRSILPVFYDVDPSDVRRQTSTFGEAFHHSYSPTEELRWRTDLHEAGNISGFHHVCNSGSDESELIENITKHVCERLDKKDLFVCNHPVGVKSRVQDLIRMSKSHSPNHVLLQGILGMGGIGKTVIAKAVYNEIGQNFESKTFLFNIREVWEQDSGPACLQQKLLTDI